MEENHQNKEIKPVDDLKEVVEALTKEFHENTEEVKKLGELIRQEKKDRNIERPFEMLFIPSRGLFYPSKENYLLLNQMTYIEETLLTSEFLVDSGKAMEFVLKNILVEQNVKPTELLTGDVEAIGLFLRSYAYGDNLEIEFDCHHCGFKEEKTIRLSSFQMKDIVVAPENGLVPMILDGTELFFMFKPLTYFEELGMARAKVSSLEKILYMTKSINGCEDRRIIESVVRKLSLQQVQRVKKFISRAIPGVDARVNHMCSSCNKKSSYNFGGVHSFLTFPSTFRQNVQEELFLITYYGENISLDDAKRMPVTERRWFINRINEELTKKKEAEEKAARQARSKSKTRKGR